MKKDKIRISTGSASVLGLEPHRKFLVKPTTCYVMTFIEGHCSANCGFCPQSRSSKSSLNTLSRVVWPTYSFNEFLEKFNKNNEKVLFKRICIQALNYPENVSDVLEIVKAIKKRIKIPISVAIPPLIKDDLIKLKKAGVNRIGIALDGSTPEIFDQVKGKGVNGPYTWKTHMSSLKLAVDVFSKGFVSTHIIVGLGETNRDILKLIEQMDKMGVLTSLFAFTPIKGTSMQNFRSPNVLNFRKIQLGRYLILNHNHLISDFIFNESGEIIGFNLNEKELKNIVDFGEAFLTAGCNGCNRPYYTSRPSGPIYNYPRQLTMEENYEIFRRLKGYVKK